MDLTPYVEGLQRELAAAADSGGEDARELAERLTAPLDSAVRLTLLDALSAAAAEITRDLAPGSVDLRLRRREAEFVVTQPPMPQNAEAGPPPAAPAPPPAPDADESAMTRINLRLPEHLKQRIEEIAGAERMSVNAWLVRAATAALEPAERRAPRSGFRMFGDQYTGWVR